MKNNKKILIIIIVVTLILDQITKIIAYKNGWNILNQNSDTSNNGYYIIMSILIIVMIIRYISNDNSFIKIDIKVILSFAISGAIGNLIDRIWNKEVICFINAGKFLNLNLSYIYIGIAWVGMAIILTRDTMKILKERKEKNNGYKRGKGN